MTAATWPTGIVLTSWDYMWRTTPMHRRESTGSSGDVAHRPPPLPEGVSTEEVLTPERGHGPLFHRRYSTRVRDARLTAEELMQRIQANLNDAAPTTFARFQKVTGDQRVMAVGDEYVVRMPGPWDGPVRVVAVGGLLFRLATLEGHLEAGQIEFRTRNDKGVVVEIESWARSSDALSNLLYHHVRMAKEVQLHMWISFLERAVRLCGGRMRGGVDIVTRRVED